MNFKVKVMMFSALVAGGCVSEKQAQDDFKYSDERFADAALQGGRL